MSVSAAFGASAAFIFLVVCKVAFNTGREIGLQYVLGMNRMQKARWLARWIVLCMLMCEWCLLSPAAFADRKSNSLQISKSDGRQIGCCQNLKRRRSCAALRRKLRVLVRYAGGVFGASNFSILYHRRELIMMF